MCEVNIDNPIDAVATIFDPIGVFGEHGLGLDPFGLALDEGEKRRMDSRSEAQQRLREYDEWASEYTNPERYQKMTEREQQQATRGVQNRYNAIGLAGSGADIGGQFEASESVRQAMIDRQMRDRNSIEQTRQGYSNQIMNMDIADENAKNAAFSQILSGAGAVAGFMAAGPAGAGAGMQAGAAFGPDQEAYIQSQNMGTPSQQWGYNNLGMNQYGVSAPTGYYDPMFGNSYGYNPVQY